MGRNKDELVSAWLDQTRREGGYERCDWPRVQWLAAACVALTIIGALAGLWPLAAGLSVLGYIGAGVFGGVMLAYYLDERLFVEKPPTQ